MSSQAWVSPAFMTLGTLFSHITSKGEDEKDSEEPKQLS